MYLMNRFHSYQKNHYFHLSQLLQKYQMNQIMYHLVRLFHLYQKYPKNLIQKYQMNQ